MAVTPRPKLGKLAPPGPLRRGPVIVLVEPQLGENIGAAARAMLNCGITELRLVNPRDGWPNPAAYVLAIVASLTTHVPGGLGVIETVVLHLIPGATVIGALVVFRVIYFLIPLAIGGPLFGITELVLRRRAGAARA